MMMNFFRNLFPVCYETPDPGATGGAGTAAPGTAPVGQGQAPPQEAAGVRQYFPNVPDEHWAIMEPHIGEMQGTMTQLQQQVAEFRPIMERGYTPQTLQGLVGFDQRFQQDPLGVWLEMGEMLQKGENGQQPVVNPDVDLEYLAAIARGEDPEAAPGSGAPVPGEQQDPSQQDPTLQYVQQLQAQVQQLEQELQQDRTQRQESVQDQVYDRQMSTMREALQGAGWPEETLTDEALGAQVIVHRGNFQAATKSLLDQRSSLLKGFVQQRTGDPPPTDLPNGVPGSPTREVRERDKGDPFKRATHTAESRLERMNRGGQ